jgi:succinate-semialdehyde dehydrogenase / glutarate-semialdehyde dehydrogenase
MALTAVNPATGETLSTFEEAGPAEIEAALARSAAAFEEWRRHPIAERAELVGRLAEALLASKEELARLATQEMGKILAESEGEVEKSAWFCEYFAERGPSLLEPQPIEGGQDQNYVHFEPLGTVLAVMPWNFPYVQVFRFAPAALVAGNVAILKHASNVPQCALAIQALFDEAGFPEGAFQALLVGPDAVEGMIADPRVRGVTLTGSDLAGSKVAAIAGRELKPAVMELGGSDPFVVLDDADIELAVSEGCRARNINAGQACIAAKRFIVVEEVADEFEARLAEAVEGLRVGDPMDPQTQVGPLARQDLVEELERQVSVSVADGAEVLTGGFDWEGEGAFVRPIVLTKVTPEMAAFREETFGPVAAIVRVPDEEAAIEMANDTQFGLGASVFSTDLDRARRVAERIDAGMVFINAIVVSDPRLPFGGMKRSGFGRELGEWGIQEFVDVKSIAVTEGPEPAGGGRAPAASASKA